MQAVHLQVVFLWPLQIVDLTTPNCFEGFDGGVYCEYRFNCAQVKTDTKKALRLARFEHCFRDGGHPSSSFSSDFIE